MLVRSVLPIPGPERAFGQVGRRISDEGCDSGLVHVVGARRLPTDGDHTGTNSAPLSPQTQRVRRMHIQPHRPHRTPLPRMRTTAHPHRLRMGTHHPYAARSHVGDAHVSGSSIGGVVGRSAKQHNVIDAASKPRKTAPRHLPCVRVTRSKCTRCGITVATMRRQQ